MKSVFCSVSLRKTTTKCSQNPGQPCWTGSWQKARFFLLISCENNCLLQGSIQGLWAQSQKKIDNEFPGLLVKGPQKSKSVWSPLTLPRSAGNSFSDLSALGRKDTNDPIAGKSFAIDNQKSFKNPCPQSRKSPSARPAILLKLSRGQKTLEEKEQSVLVNPVLPQGLSKKSLYSTVVNDQPQHAKGEGVP